MANLLKIQIWHFQSKIQVKNKLLFLFLLGNGSIITAVSDASLSINEAIEAANEALPIWSQKTPFVNQN